VKEEGGKATNLESKRAETLVKEAIGQQVNEEVESAIGKGQDGYESTNLVKDDESAIL
jgi:hypothetical protein